ncbi:thioesterase family protein [Emcibacter sp. SYSU 3D8]|uniref:thioesterase family protein n=1 Tax=Emcibacter sp. SYSU 3D8 TaxID=3133969 RepID=UPI0031FF0A84
MIDIFKGMANTWECDENGHLNVRFYASKVGEGLATLWHHLGMSRTARRVSGLEMAVADQHLRFLREMHPGWGLVGRAGILEVGEDRLRVYVELVNGHTDAVSATFNMLIVSRDRKTGEPMPLAEPVRARAEALLMDLPPHGAPRSIALDDPGIFARGAPSLAQTENMGLIEITRGVVQPIECDDAGIMLPEFYIGRISDGVVHLARHYRPVDTGKERSTSKYGGAVLEYRLRFNKPLHRGNIVVVRSGLKHVGEKANHIVHWTFNGETGELVSASEAIGITLDLEARKVVPLPEERKAHLQKLVIPGLAA